MGIGLLIRSSIRPLRLIVSLAVAFVIAFVVWLFFVIASTGTAFGPGEYAAFDSRRHLIDGGFRELGAEWPGSSITYERRDDGTGVLERRWLWWSEVRIPIDQDYGFDTAGYVRGPGETIQQWIAHLLGIATGLGVLLSLRRWWRPPPGVLKGMDER